MKNCIFSLCLLLGLYGCGSHPDKQNSAPELSVEEELHIADSAIERWQESGQIRDLEIALFHYGDLHRRHPDNVLRQRSYYQTLFWQVASTRQQPTTELESLFSQLNPLVRQDLSPPSTISYLAAVSRKSPPQQLIPLLGQMVKDQPFSSYAWSQLAEAYARIQQPWLSLAAAQRASALDPDDPDYWFWMGRGLQRIAMVDGCSYSEPAFNKKAAAYFAKAAAKDKNVRNLSASANAYLNLGLFPLAYSEAKKAYGTSAIPMSRFYYSRATEYMQMFDETERLAQEMLRGEPDQSAHEILARLDARNKKWSTAATHMRQFVNSDEKDLLAALRLQWLEQLAGRSSIQPQSGSQWPAWYRSIFAFINDAQQTPQGFDFDALVRNAKTPCEATEAYFYTAYAHWLHKNRSQTLHYLKLATQSEAKAYTEYLWAVALLPIL